MCISTRRRKERGLFAVMYQELPQAIAVVHEAYRQKHGREPPPIEEADRKSVCEIPESEVATSHSRALAIIRNLVALYEQRSTSETRVGVETSRPVGATAIADLERSSNPQSENIKFPADAPPVQYQVQPPPSAPFASPEFCKALPVADGCLKVSLPLGMVKIGGVFVPAGGLEPRRWPCMLLEIEGAEPKSSVYVTSVSTTECGSYYKCESDIILGPVASGDRTRKFWLKDCTNDELRFGLEASVGSRITIRDAQVQRRFHALTFPSGKGLHKDVDVSTLTVLDDKGDEIGKVKRAFSTDTNGTYREISDGDDLENSVYALEMTMSGSGPVSVSVSSIAPSICVI